MATDPGGHRRRRRPGRDRGRKAAFDGWSPDAPSRSGPSTCTRIAEGLAARTEEIAADHRRRGGHADHAVAARSRPACRRPTSASAAPGRRGLPVRGAGRQLAWSCASRSASSAASRRGTTRCTRSSPRSRPALAAGCTVVLKPSEVAPLNAFILAEVIDEVGLPAGVFNLVTGVGPVVGEAIAAAPRRRHGVASPARPAPASGSPSWPPQTVKRVALELGGKSANVILDDADLDTAVADRRRQVLPQLGPDLLGPHPHAGAPRQAGRGRGASPRRRPRRYTPGDPFETTTPPRPAGAPTSSATGSAATSTRASTRAPRSSPAAPSAPEGLDKGYFVQPTVFSDVTPDMTIAQEEIFGPVLSIMPYDDEDEAVRIANDTRLRPGRRRVVRRPRAGQGRRPAHAHRPGRDQRRRLQPEAPFGGYKQSGNGRELGKFGLEEFLEVKSLQL